MTISRLFSLEGQKAFVLGGSRGIGREIALAFAEAGADVAVASQSFTASEAVAAEVRAEGRHGLALEVDARDEASVTAAAQAAAKALGGPTLWVNAVGGAVASAPMRLVDLDPAMFDAIVALNMRSAWTGTKVGAGLLEQGGAIINISSLAGAILPQVGLGAYGAAKAGVNSLTATFAQELAPRLRINAIAPGPVLTEAMLAYKGVSADEIGTLPPPPETPMGRHAMPRDIAAIAVFLAAPASAWITGQCLYATGGRFWISPPAVT